jgi:hypothetical protein
MKLFEAPVSHATPAQLKQAQLWLAVSFLIVVFTHLADTWLSVAALSVPPFAGDALGILSLAAGIALYVTLYIAATRLGFPLLTVILALVCSLLFPLLALVLVVSAIVRISQQLKRKK